MSRKKLDVVELNKKEEEIILEENSKGLLAFLKKYGILVFLILLILLSLGGILLAKYIKNSTDPSISKISLDISGIETTDITISSNDIITKKTAEDNFNNGPFKKSGEVLLIKEINKDNFTIKFYSDGVSLKINKDGSIVKINSINGKYGIDEEGIISTASETKDITVLKKKDYQWGIVTYLSDGSAMITDSDKEIYVRNSSDIKDNYISSNKVSYIKETKNYGNNKINYYYDGTIEVITDNKEYIIRNKEDIKIEESNITFPNNNEATIIKEKNLSDGFTIKYYSDGGAIIIDPSGNKISVRKSNSIVIKEDKIFEIVDNIYVDLVNTKGKTKYYSNGSAITEYNGKTIYASENSNIKLGSNNIVKNVEEKYEELTKKTNDGNVTVLMFETVAYVETTDYKAIVDKESVLFNSDGTFKEILESKLENVGNTFSITNNTDKTVKYRVVIEKSDRSTLKEEYIMYQLSTKDTYIETTKLNKNLWQEKALASKLSVKGTNYVLIESSLEPFDTVDINLMLWIDYETIPNSMQNKYFYGTIKVYSWAEK